METQDGIVEDGSTEPKEQGTEAAASSVPVPAVDAGGAGAYRGSSVDTDQAIINLTKSDLTQRVLIGRNWNPSVPAYELVQMACQEWLEEYEPEPRKPLDTCKECGGGDQHEPSCILLQRKRRRK